MATNYELTIDQGATFGITVQINDYFTGAPMNLYGYSARSQMRKNYTSSEATEFTVAIQDVANGNISMSMSSSNTANLAPGRYVYDLEMEDSYNVVTRLLEGIVVVTPNVTR